MENMIDISMVLPLIFIGFLTETVVEIIKENFFPKKITKAKKLQYVNIVSLIVAVILCFSLQVSLFEPSNVLAYYIGVLICGLVASRGSSYVHNFFDTLPSTKKKA